MKILRNFCLHFERQDGQDGKNRKENHATKVTKIPNTKRQIWDERNFTFHEKHMKESVCNFYLTLPIGYGSNVIRKAMAAKSN